MKLKNIWISVCLRIISLSKVYSMLSVLWRLRRVFPKYPIGIWIGIDLLNQQHRWEFVDVLCTDDLKCKNYIAKPVQYNKKFKLPIRFEVLWVTSICEFNSLIRFFFFSSHLYSVQILFHSPVECVGGPSSFSSEVKLCHCMLNRCLPINFSSCSTIFNNKKMQLECEHLFINHFYLS